MRYAALLTLLALGVSGEVFNLVNQPGQSSPIDLHGCNPVQPLNISLLEEKPEYEAQTWLVGVWLKFDTPIPDSSSFLTLVTRDDFFNVSFVENRVDVQYKSGGHGFWMPDEFATNWFFVGFGGDNESFFFLLTSYHWTAHFTDSHRSLTAPYLQIPGSCIDVIVRLIQGSIGTVQVMIDEPADLSIAEKMASNTFCDLSCTGSCSAPGLKNCIVCDQTCSSCIGPTDQDCLSCKNGYPRETSGGCYCPAAHYPNPTSLNCAPCISTCAFCAGPKAEDCWFTLVDFFITYVEFFHEDFPYLSQQPNGLICYGMMQPTSCADTAYLRHLGPFEISQNGSWTLNQTQCQAYLKERWTYANFLFDQLFPTLSIPTYDGMKYFWFVTVLKVWILRFGNYEMNQPSWQLLLAFLNDPSTDWSQVFCQSPNIFYGTQEVKLPATLQTWLQKDNNREIYEFNNWHRW